MPPASEIQALLAEDRWIRRLAARLVTDPGAADDLVQETYLTVLSSPTRPRSARAWLGGVLRNLWRDGARSGARRERRERGAARPEALPAAAELVAEVELRKRVAEAVLALEEPLRRTVVLRFFQDRSLPAIAAAEGVSVSTVHERVQRALGRLRRELDRAHGGRREAWAATLIPLAREASAALGTVEVLAMASVLKVAVSIAVLGAGAAWWWWESGASEAAPRGVPDAPAVVAAPRTDAPAVPLGPAALAREALVPESAAAPAPLTDVVEPAFLSGRVVDPSGHAQGGVRVAWSPALEGAEPAVSAADGTYELARGAHALEARAVCVSPGLVTLVSGQAFGGWTLVVAPRADFAGNVWDDSGAPVPGAELEFRLKPAVFHAAGIHAMGLEDEGWRTTSDAAGRFELRGVSGGPGVTLLARARGCAEAEVALPEGGDPALSITLQRNQAVELRGIVLDPRGDPVPGASVSAGREIVTTGADGRFTLLWTGGNGKFELDESGVWREPGAERSSVIALAPGYRPAQEALRERDLALPFVLRLGPPLTIAGRVLDPAGTPLSGIVVWPQDPTRFGRERVDIAGLDLDRDRTVEARLCKSSAGPGVLTDADGRFELGCLMEREYALRAHDPRSAARAGPWTVAAGARGVELVFAPEPSARVAGRIVSARGEPRAGLRITPRRTHDWSEGAEAPALSGADLHAETDADGRFAFESLAIGETSLDVAAPPFSNHQVDLAEHPDLGNLEIVVPVLCEAQVELVGDPAAADRARMLDERGSELELNEVYGGENSFAWTMETEVELVDGRSRLLFVPETARTLVLYRAGQEVLRVSIQLEPGRRVVLRP